MKDLLLLHVRKFLENRLVPTRPVLLGYSGGPDSKALLYLCLACRRFFAVELHLAHVDHGWREESEKESLEIEAEAKQLGIPLHTRVLKSDQFLSGNLEEQGRKHRYAFFSEIYNALGCQALLLGHHADDQAEVVMKRVFEGSSLFAMEGIAPESQFADMRIVRPLLAISKKQIEEWLSTKGLRGFVDPTNFSRRFLRGRMRTEMFPELQKSFGKEVSANLCRLGEESREIKEYFGKLNAPILATIQREPEMSRLSIVPFLPLPRLQLKYLLKAWMGIEKVVFSREILGGVIDALAQESEAKKFLWKGGMLLIKNGTIFFYKQTKLTP